MIKVVVYTTAVIVGAVWGVAVGGETFEAGGVNFTGSSVGMAIMGLTGAVAMSEFVLLQFQK